MKLNNLDNYSKIYTIQNTLENNFIDKEDSKLVLETFINWIKENDLWIEMNDLLRKIDTKEVFERAKNG